MHVHALDMCRAATGEVTRHMQLNQPPEKPAEMSFAAKLMILSQRCRSDRKIGFFPQSLSWGWIGF
jgi:hypothetical protein